MNILYVGAESANWIINLCNEFCKLGNTVTCVVQNLDEYDKEHPLKEHVNLTRINLSYDELINPDKLIPKLKEIGGTAKFDIIIGSHCPVSPPVYIIGKMLNIPTGVMILDIPTDLIMEEPTRKSNWNIWFPYIKEMDLVITNTNMAREEFMRFTGRIIPKENVIPYAINVIEEYDKKGLDIKGDYVISVCRLTEKKNCILIPRALSKLDLNIGYVAIGRDRGELSKIKEYCENHNIEFKHYPMVSERDKYNLIANSSMLIYPQNSEYIGGLSPFEAMYSGKPAVVPYLNILTDLYEDSAFYFKNNDEFDLANVIAVIHSYNRNILKPRLLLANTKVKQEALFSVMANRMLNLMEKVCKK